MQLSVTNEYWSLFSSAVILTASVRGGCRFQIGGIPPYLPDKQTPYGYISYSHIRMNTLKHKPGVSNLSYLSTKYQLIGFQAQEKMDRLPSTLSGPSRTCPQHFPLSQLPLLKTKGVLFPFHYTLNIMSVGLREAEGGGGGGEAQPGPGSGGCHSVLLPAAGPSSGTPPKPPRHPSILPCQRELCLASAPQTSARSCVAIVSSPKLQEQDDFDDLIANPCPVCDPSG